ncbi:MAG TPA: NAD-dependent epimerase/dehydratase family protein, partial [Burkholderiales bacterium]
MKRVLVIGAAGMIGRKLVERLAGEAGELILHDVVPPTLPAGVQGKAIASDLSAPGEAEKLLASRP